MNQNKDDLCRESVDVYVVLNDNIVEQARFDLNFPWSPFKFSFIYSNTQ